MREITNTDGNVTKIFANTFEQEAYDQIEKLANFPAYLGSKIRIMPDAHAGVGCTVGTTMTITDQITPNLVGVDIGCGMLTVELKEKEVDLELLDQVVNEYIPSGFGVHDEPATHFSLSGLRCFDHVDIDRVKKSLGSLGGGNHFIELAGSSKSDKLALIIHSGSRKLGVDVCKYYQRKAVATLEDNIVDRQLLIHDLKSQGKESEIQERLKLMKKPEIDKDLAYLSGQDFLDYLHDMDIAQRFAAENRETMADIILYRMGLSEASRMQTIHNYIDLDEMIVRKGAVSAQHNELLLIPINMRDGSLLCRGKGNPDWNFSAPHGAGRLMSRSKARKELDLGQFERDMKNVYSSSVGEATLDEAPEAYKPADEIIDAIQDTVEVIDILVPLYNFKAH